MCKSFKAFFKKFRTIILGWPQLSGKIEMGKNSTNNLSLYHEKRNLTFIRCFFWLWQIRYHGVFKKGRNKLYELNGSQYCDRFLWIWLTCSLLKSKSSFERVKKNLRQGVFLIKRWLDEYFKVQNRAACQQIKFRFGFQVCIQYNRNKWKLSDKIEENKYRWIFINKYCRGWILVLDGR